MPALHKQIESLLFPPVEVSTLWHREVECLGQGCKVTQTELDEQLRFLTWQALLKSDSQSLCWLLSMLEL